MYAANYIFNTGGVRWALDPLTLKHRLPEAPETDLLPALDGLSFILLTHRHSDHFNPGLVHALRDMPTLWVVPAPLLHLLESGGLPLRQVIVPSPLESFEIEGVRIIPFDGLHFEKDSTQPEGVRGVPAIAYLVEFRCKRWLFPGDTRTYDASQLPSFGPVDCLFAHLWLGRGAALQSISPLLDDFCKFCLALQPKRIILTHLNEWGRQVDDFWGFDHAQIVASVLANQQPFLPVEVAFTGDEIRL
jgi:L-ascorbate metabolism protein UlaG (beta-lactamase superfamily)